MRDVVGVVASFYNIDEVAVYEKTRKKKLLNRARLLCICLGKILVFLTLQLDRKWGAGPHNSDAFMREGA